MAYPPDGRHRNRSIADPASNRRCVADGRLPEWVLPFAAASRLEPVTAAVHRQNVAGLRPLGLDFLPQGRDVAVDRACIDFRGKIPDVTQQLLARDDPAAIVDQVAQQLKLERRKGDGSSVAINVV